MEEATVFRYTASTANQEELGVVVARVAGGVLRRLRRRRRRDAEGAADEAPGGRAAVVVLDTRRIAPATCAVGTVRCRCAARQKRSCWAVAAAAEQQ